jgi:hypothetical protein
MEGPNRMAITTSLSDFESLLKSGLDGGEVSGSIIYDRTNVRPPLQLTEGHK